MNSAIQEFLDFLETENDEDYGDFMRETDHHLMRMVDSMRALTPEQVWTIRKLREQLLWSYQSDIETVKAELREGVRHLDQ
ncbi:hypothetical protein D3C87_1399890 [compost metagenome]